jgi:hypothetical protein
MTGRGIWEVRRTLARWVKSGIALQRLMIR